MRPVDVAWAAGFLDGEGTYAYGQYSSRGRLYRKLKISCAQVPREPLDKLQALFGGKVYGPYGPYKGNRQPYYQWHMEGHLRVQAAIAAMHSFMTQPKRDQAEQALRDYNVDHTLKMSGEHQHSWCRVCCPKSRVLKENR